MINKLKTCFALVLILLACGAAALCALQSPLLGIKMAGLQKPRLDRRG